MKKWFLHIFLVSVLGMLTASCSQEVEELTPTHGKEGRVQLNFTIVLDDSPTSRTWGSSYEQEAATKAENAVNNMQVLLFDTNGTTCYGALENVQYFSIDALDKRYEFQGSIPLDADNELISTTDGVDELNCKIMVLANCSVDATKTDAIATALNNLTYTASDIYSSATGLKAGIPMWGITTVSDLPVNRNYATYLPESQDIWLLRSMAKIEVTLSDETSKSGYSLSGATLSESLNNGFVVPAYTDEAATTDLGIEEVFNPSPSSTGTTQNVGFTGNANTYYIYVPEYNARSAALEIELTLNNGNNSDTKSFKHGEYKDGSFQNAWNVIRNHCYKYTVSLKNGADLEVIISIYDWIYTLTENSATLNPDQPGL